MGNKTYLYYAFRGISDKLGLTRLLKTYFPENWELMVTAAQHMLSEGNVMYYLKDYTEGHKTSAENSVDDERVSRMFSQLRQEDMLLFFREWMKVKRSKEYVAYDVTFISSYGKSIAELEWGYNRDKEKLPQVNMGMYYGEESGSPLYYRIYPGSISDKSHLRHMISYRSFIGKLQRTIFELLELPAPQSPVCGNSVGI